MCSYGECLEQVEVTKALSFSCNNSVRMNSTTVLCHGTHLLNPRHAGVEIGSLARVTQCRFTDFKLLPRDSHAIAYRLPQVQ